MPDIEITIKVTEGYNLDTKIRVAGHCVHNTKMLDDSLDAMAAKAVKRALAAIHEGNA